MTELQPTTPTGYAELLLELGMGFAFVGSQYRLAVRGSEFYVDLLFCHLRPWWWISSWAFPGGVRTQEEFLFVRG